MTTIAYKKGHMAADTAVGSNGGCFAHLTKIFRNKKGDLAGASGGIEFHKKFKDWFLGGEKGPPPSTAVPGKPDEHNKAIIVRKSEHILWLEHTELTELEWAPIAIGSGAPEARGAMFVGASAIEAVKAAFALDDATGGDIIALTHTGPIRRIKAGG